MDFQLISKNLLALLEMVRVLLAHGFSGKHEKTKAAHLLVLNLDVVQKMRFFLSRPWNALIQMTKTRWMVSLTKKLRASLIIKSLVHANTIASLNISTAPSRISLITSLSVRLLTGAVGVRFLIYDISLAIMINIFNIKILIIVCITDSTDLITNTLMIVPPYKFDENSKTWKQFCLHSVCKGRYTSLSNFSAGIGNSQSGWHG